MLDPNFFLFLKANNYIANLINVDNIKLFKKSGLLKLKETKKYLNIY